MIDVVDSNAVSYYHFDGLGSVVALSNSSGTTIQTYEYTIYGEVAAEDPNHPNPYLFTGRRFDRETGLYYYRARYYNPYIGRFLQTDPVGYDDGMNWYAYCGNNPVVSSDPSGLAVNWRWYGYFQFLEDVESLTFQYWDENGEITTKEFTDLEQWETWARVYFAGSEDEMAGSTLAGGDDELFWELQKMAFLCRNVGAMLDRIDENLKITGQEVTIKRTREGNDRYDYGTNTLYWNDQYRGSVNYFTGAEPGRAWHTAPAMVGLAHELRHCLEDLIGVPYVKVPSETAAMATENDMRYALFKRVPGCQWIVPRPGYAEGTEDIKVIAEDTKDIVSPAAQAWKIYWKNRSGYPIW